MNKRKGKSFFLLCAVFSLYCLSAEELVHLVRQGETIYSIARSYKVDRDELMRLNGISDPSRLQAGQRLKIPGAPSASPGGGTAAAASGAASSARGGAYQVLRGDTLYGIARRFGVELDALLKLNSLASSYVLKQGDVLQIPGLSSNSKADGTSRDGTAAGLAVTKAPSPPADTPPRPSAATNVATTPARPAPADENRRGTAATTANAATAALALRWPVAARELDYMTGKLPGVAITGERTESVKSLTSGTVISAGPYRGFGRVAIVQVEGGYLYVYGGCESLAVQEGDKVGPGTELGRLGVDTVSGKPRLFFLVYRSYTPIDPAKAPRA